MHWTGLQVSEIRPQGWKTVLMCRKWRNPSEYSPQGVSLVTPTYHVSDHRVSDLPSNGKAFIPEVRLTDMVEPSFGQSEYRDSVCRKCPLWLPLPGCWWPETCSPEETAPTRISQTCLHGPALYHECCLCVCLEITPPLPLCPAVRNNPTSLLTLNNNHPRAHTRGLLSECLSVCLLLILSPP